MIAPAATTPPPQLDMFQEATDTVSEKFRAFHARYPKVYMLFEKFTLQLIASGRGKVGARMIVERIRWECALDGAKDEDGFKINNMFIAHYARLFIRNHSEHKECFELRNMKVL